MANDTGVRNTLWNNKNDSVAREKSEISPLGYRFFSEWEGEPRWDVAASGNAAKNPRALVARRPPHALLHGAYVEFVEVRGNLEEIGVGLTFLDVAQQYAGVFGSHLDGEVQRLADPDVGYLPVFGVRHLPMVASAAADGFHADLPALNVGLAGTRIFGIVRVQILRGITGGSAATPLAGFLLDVHLLLHHQYVDRFRREVRDYAGLMPLCGHVHSHMPAAHENLPGRIDGSHPWACGGHLHVGGERRKSRHLGGNELDQQ